jgi:serine/threonine-protein kinase HipA
MARAAGVEMSETRLLEEHGRAHFMTRRFDRTDDGERLHMLTLCGMDGLDFNAIGVNDYAQYFARIVDLDLGVAALEEAFRRMAFNVLAANCDDHTKNVAFLMDSAGTWSLAPAYDVTHAYAPDSRWLSQHLMSVNGKFADITRADLLAVADSFGIERAAAAIGEVRDALGSWPEFASEAGLSPAHADAIAADFASLVRAHHDPLDAGDGGVVLARDAGADIGESEDAEEPQGDAADDDNPTQPEPGAPEGGAANGVLDEPGGAPGEHDGERQ